ncbi:GNAT family N-acetyltransferase [Streptomyces catenulae]|uniref:GNAT family N-acetyltransferase n=1 Tax=Streptomyces catenulae TaxID=66875 RepID=A0ABV2Z5B7_9ACTN|nr:GNAT family N-acetyltransferase [Streptomyces catenulae]
MTWTTTADPDAFDAAAGAFLRARPVEHTMLLSVAATVRKTGADAYGDHPPRYGWWQEKDAVGAAFLWTPPHPVLLSTMPERAASALADTLTAERRPVPGIGGDRTAVDAFATTWLRHHGGTIDTVERSRLHRLGTLLPPRPGPPGAARPATTTADRALVLEWFTAFATDAGVAPPRDARTVDDRIAHGRVLLWEDAGRPVAMAAHTGADDGVTRVAPVYTPPELRGRGYAGAVTAALSQTARDTGAHEVLLFTDLANPTANALYQRLGYEAVRDRVVVEFRGTDAPEAGAAPE